MAKSPVPGQVKTRLCPPLFPAGAAAVAAAALLDTLDAVDDFHRRDPTLVRGVLALSGRLTDAPAGPAVAARLVGAAGSNHRWTRIIQRGTGFADRLVHAHADAGPWPAPGTGDRPMRPGSILQIGMDTPQITADLLGECAASLSRPGVDAVLGPASDGGWWALGLHDPRLARVLRGVGMSRPDTGQLTLRALADLGVVVELLPELTDVDTMADAELVAGLIPRSRFAAALRGARRVGVR